jgi:peptidyl-prolyl cis-trans isomerase SurA
LCRAILLAATCAGLSGAALAQGLAAPAAAQPPAAPAAIPAIPAIPSISAPRPGSAPALGAAAGPAASESAASGPAASGGAASVPPASGPAATGPAVPGSAASTPAAAPRRPQIQLVDRIVAVVNKQVITQNQLNERVDFVRRRLEARGVQLPPANVLQRQVLERMIADRAQLQLAEESGIKIDDLQVDRAMERIAAQNKMSLADFRQAVERDGISFNKLREDIRSEITLARIREREVDGRIQVTESEIDNYLAEEAARNRQSSADVQYLVSHILIRVPENATPDQSAKLRQRAEEALKQVRSGADFAKVAVALSDAPDGLQGGDMGWRSRDRLPDLYLNALEKMHPAEVSEVLQSPAGFHLVRLADQRGALAEGKVVEQYHARHILIRINEQLSDAEARRRIEQLRARIVEGADFAEVARLNSDDSSAQRGGDLGWLLPGDTVPEFETAMVRLEPNQISPPVKTPFGWHIIQLLERRRGDIASDRRRMEAQKVVKARKADEAFDNWLRELQDRTYVEYRLDDQ